MSRRNKDNTEPVMKTRWICECSPNESFKADSNVCPKCEAECVTADEFITQGKFDCGINSPKIMEARPKKESLNKPVMIEGDFRYKASQEARNKK